ncbi:d2hgdh [Symbiodinium sp. CCMP2456]|nr:d2hgdh [Symbiodinium sp. CCMP2456]
MVALARELDMLEEGQQGPKELEVEMISPLSKVSFRNFSVDLSDQPASPTHAATEFLRGALAKTPIDLEELSMALEQAKRADVDSMLLLRGEDVFMELIEKQAAVTRLATALQNRMLKDLRQAIAKAETSKIGPDEFPDASGCGIVKRAKAVVEQEELAAMEELRRSLNAGVRHQAPILTFEPGNVVTPEESEREELLRFNQDWMGKWEGRSAAILKPASTEEVSAVLRYASEKNLAVVPQGGNTGLVGGSVPVHDELVLSLLRMNQVEALDTRSGIVTVQAGCVLEQLDQYLAKHDFMVPLDLGAKGTCTIGGNAATNAGGLRYLRYGSLRGNILGLEAVLADGKVVNSLSALRKDNTGYGLPQLFIGSEGTLGVITKLTILCPTRPKAINIAFFACSDFENVQRTFALARQNLGEVLSAVEFCDRAAIDFVLKREAGTGVRDPLEETYPFYAGT